MDSTHSNDVMPYQIKIIRIQFINASTDLFETKELARQKNRTVITSNRPSWLFVSLTDGAWGSGVIRLAARRVARRALRRCLAACLAACFAACCVLRGVRPHYVYAWRRLLLDPVASVAVLRVR
jgi:hypothetical protein